MRLEEKKGPFSKGSKFQLVNSGGYVHIGIQIPKCQPLSANWKDTIPYINVGPPDKPRIDIQLTKEEQKRLPNPFYDTIQDTYKNESVIDYAPKPDIAVSFGGSQSNPDYTSQFYVNRCGILEFDCSLGSPVYIEILKDMPPETIIDLVYDDSQKA